MFLCCRELKISKINSYQNQPGIETEPFEVNGKKYGYLDIVKHPNIAKYPNQKMFILNIEDYIYLVPFIESSEILFLKTIIPSRKATKKYIKEIT